MPSNPASYSYGWALGRAEELYRAHPRATELVLELLEISLKQAAVFLAKRDPAWVELREAIHIVENWSRKPGFSPSVLTATDVFYDVLRRRNRLRLVGRLDSLGKCAMLEEQGLKGGSRSEGYSPSEDSPHYIPPLQLELFE